jgi:adenosylmethionine-8-amino-7-oxononanoate aminotransferase
MEFVADRETDEPLAPALGFNKLFKKAAFAAGLICYPMGGTIDGRRGDHVLLAPPFIIDDNHVEEIVSKLDTALETSIAQL